MTIALPWPPQALKPNARVHWAVKAKAAKAYRLSCYFLARKAQASVPEGRLLLVLEFVPPDKRRRDADNLLASSKSLIDGVADALVKDDYHFAIQFCISRETIKGGEVRVTIRSAE